MRKRTLALLLLLTMSIALLAGCGGSSAETAGTETGEAAAAETETSETDFLMGAWFAQTASKDGETRDSDEVFGGTFYLYFFEDNECNMCIDDKRAPVKWELTDDGVTLTGDNTYEITFPDESRETMIITINGIEVLMEKYVEE